MARQNGNPLKSLLDAPKVREAARALIEAVHEETRERELAPKSYERALREIERLRGRPLFHKALASGVGRGARVRLSNGLTVLDLAAASAPSSPSSARASGRSSWASASIDWAISMSASGPSSRCAPRSRSSA